MRKLSKFNTKNEKKLVCVDVFSCFVLFKSMKSEYSSGSAAAFTKKLRKNIKYDRVCVHQCIEFWRKVIKIYCTRCEQNAIAAERAIRSLKQSFHRQMDMNGDRYANKANNFFSHYEPIC